ncbi:MAG: hypothetical protein EAZ66_05950, partial [Alphaproteobacteria bacterium]
MNAPDKRDEHVEEWIVNRKRAFENYIKRKSYGKKVLDNDRLDLEDKENLIKLRKRIGYAVLGVVCAWLIFVSSVLIAQGLHEIDISDRVIITLLTTTILNIFILLKVIIKSLY